MINPPCVIYTALAVVHKHPNFYEEYNSLCWSFFVCAEQPEISTLSNIKLQVRIEFMKYTVPQKSSHL